ncbi:porin [Caballeronia mineralivorans PML1(12)]|uniref:Porin n=1 Tax=Caballeronia mineralivorans PML1(12) TaxID=908627 RepID=A0A0J1FMT5_9BURK|nr:porin [Caballeronia mineralivorans]KLU21038.1 porin [Caballeronia mineralivorans PML1(12)]
MQTRHFLAVAAIGSIANAAHAQSSVTLYGIIDNGIAYVNNIGGAHAVQASTANLYGNRFGLKGAEDLGQGLKAVFTLEGGFNGFSGRSGQGSREFGRQAYVGLSDARYGTLTLGRQYDPLVDTVANFSAQNEWATDYAAHPGDADNLDGSFRINNAVKYVSPTYAGLQFEALYGLSNQASAGNGAGFSNNRAYAASASYANGPLNFAVAYLKLNNPGAANNTSGAVSGDYGGTLYVSPQSGAAASSDAVIATGGTYAIGKATLGAVYSNVKLSYFDQTSLHLDNYEINGQYQLTPALLLGIAYTYTDGKSNLLSGTQRPRYHQAELGTNYSLSRRTSVYLVGIYQQAAGDAKNAEIAELDQASSTNKQILIVAGLKHSF